MTFYGTHATTVKESKHFTFDDLEFWAEDGVICISDTRNGDINTVTRRDFAKRAHAINEESKRSNYADERDKLNNCVIDMHEVWMAAKFQGDPCDPEVMKQKLRERKRAILTPSLLF